MAKVSVLVVDDAPFIRDLVKKALRSHFPGLLIEEAINGRKAQQVLSRNVFDLILCDWEMPELSGLELLKWFRGQPDTGKTPFIMVTSRGDKENEVEAIQAGVSDYIGKPFSNEQLIAKVRKALQRAGKLSLLNLRRLSQTVAFGCPAAVIAVMLGVGTSTPWVASAMLAAALASNMASHSGYWANMIVRSPCIPAHLLPTKSAQGDSLSSI